MAPLIFIIESQLPIFARTGLALMAVSTSGVSTGVIAWAAHPYVLILRRIDPANNGGTKGLEFVTANWRLQKRITRVYDTTFLTTTDRPFAKWQLAEKLVLPEQAEPSSASPASLPNLTPAQGSQETVAETFDASGDLIGSWIVTWDNHEGRGVGTCRAVGTVVKHFQVHPELFELH
ncbi:hypothetical protein BDP27DRAFT_1428569 [Rhodocollybia butyracea]|uniref:Uncharacterized protein n=1 Tax=Rhodocollybia butyracea TaxID=206335 RepID=A0A9P5U0Y1_9AGAR|nr:hypothetical protein BDP27DRAFT_1428569 [Rhodocollybia butyracea]